MRVGLADDQVFPRHGLQVSPDGSLTSPRAHCDATARRQARVASRSTRAARQWTLQLGKDGNKMSNRFSANADWAPASAEEEPRQDALDTEDLENSVFLSVEEIERLIAYCEAPALLWRDEPETARAPEPFGMIA
jgi:hypothetical protein